MVNLIYSRPKSLERFIHKIKKNEVSGQFIVKVDILLNEINLNSINAKYNFKH